MTKKPTDIYKCKCGAVTATIDGKQYSMLPATYREKFNVERVPRAEFKCYSCNYCVNHWGLELCACGSGKKYNKCKEGFKECGTPMQSIEKGKDTP